MMDLMTLYTVYTTTKTVCMLVRQKQSQGRYSTRVRLGNVELCLVESFVTQVMLSLQTFEMIKILKNNSRGKIQLAICWSGSTRQVVVCICNGCLKLIYIYCNSCNLFPHFRYSCPCLYHIAGEIKCLYFFIHKCLFNCHPGLEKHNKNQALVLQKEIL